MHKYIHTYTRTTTQQRIHHNKRSPDAVVDIKHAYTTTQQHIQSDNMSNDRRIRSLEKKNTRKHTYTHTHIYNNNPYTHTPYRPLDSVVRETHTNTHIHTRMRTATHKRI